MGGGSSSRENSVDTGHQWAANCCMLKHLGNAKDNASQMRWNVQRKSLHKQLHTFVLLKQELWL